MFVILYAIPCKSCELEGTEWFRRSRCTNSFDTEAPLLGLDWSITNGIVSSKIYDKRDDFYFEICNHYDCPSFAERSDYCVTLDSSILMFHWVRPFTVVFLSFRCFVFRCMSVSRSEIMRLCNEVASLLTYSVTHFFVAGWFFSGSTFSNKKYNVCL